MFRDADLQLKAIVESVGEAIMVQDRNFQCVYANELAAKICGFNSAEEFINTKVENVLDRVQLLTEDGQPFPREQLTARKVLNGEKHAIAVYRSREVKTGIELWAKATSRPILDIHNQVAYAVTVFRDITTEKEAEIHAKFLADVSNMFASSLDYKKTLASLGDLVVPKLADWYGIELVNDQGILEIIHTVNVDPEKTKVAIEMRQKYPSLVDANSGAYKVLKTGIPEIVEEISQSQLEGYARSQKHLEMLKILNLKSYVIVPIKVREQIIGVMHFCHSSPERRFSKADVNLLLEVAYRTGLAVENVRLFTEAQAEKARAINSEERLQLALEGSAIGLWEWHIQSDKLFFSDRCLEIFGVRREDFHGSFYKDFTQFLQPDEVNRVVAAVEESVQKRFPYTIEYKIITPPGKPEKWVHARGQTYYDNSGKPYRMVGTVIDISSRRESETARRRIEQKVSQLHVISSMLSKAISPQDIAKIIVTKGLEVVGAVAGSIVMFDADKKTLRYLYSNGYSKKVMDMWPVLNIDQDLPIPESIRTGEPVIVKSLQEQHARYPSSYLRDDEEHDVKHSFGSFPLQVQGEVIGALGLSFNHEQEFRPSLVEYLKTLADQAAQALDRARVYEEAQEERLNANKASQAKSLFLANMSHEIRTPMNAILGFSKLLREEQVTDLEKEEFLRRIEANGDHLLHLIDDILDLSRVEAGQMRIDEQPISLKELVKDVHQSLQGLVTEKNIKTELILDPNLPEEIISDSVRIKQILMNLVGNSAKFTHEGFIKIKADCDLRKKEIYFQIEDSGAGIDPQTQSQLFKPFSQGDASITRKYGGTGLGLILSRKIAEAFGGSLQLVRSEKEKGTVFKIVLPIRSEPAEGVLKKEKNKIIEPVMDKKLKVLLAEDVIDNQVLINLYLRSSNIKLSLANNGLEVLQKVAEDKFDLILMDIQMPQMDGLETTRRLRTQGFKGPIIALTAHALQEEIKNSVAAGCNGHLTKPISKNVLLEQIYKYTKAHQQNLKQ